MNDNNYLTESETPEVGILKELLELLILDDSRLCCHTLDSELLVKYRAARVSAPA